MVIGLVVVVGEALDPFVGFAELAVEFGILVDEFLDAAAFGHFEEGAELVAFFGEELVGLLEFLELGLDFGDFLFEAGDALVGLGEFVVAGAEFLGEAADLGLLATDDLVLDLAFFVEVGGEVGVLLAEAAAFCLEGIDLGLEGLVFRAGEVGFGAAAVEGLGEGGAFAFEAIDALGEAFEVLVHGLFGHACAEAIEFVLGFLEFGLEEIALAGEVVGAGAVGGI